MIVESALLLQGKGLLTGETFKPKPSGSETKISTLSGSIFAPRLACFPCRSKNYSLQRKRPTRR